MLDPQEMEAFVHLHKDQSIRRQVKESVNGHEPSYTCERKQAKCQNTFASFVCLRRSSPV